MFSRSIANTRQYSSVSTVSPCSKKWIRIAPCTSKKRVNMTFLEAVFPRKAFSGHLDPFGIHWEDLCLLWGSKQYSQVSSLLTILLMKSCPPSPRRAKLSAASSAWWFICCWVRRHGTNLAHILENCKSFCTILCTVPWLRPDSTTSSLIILRLSSSNISRIRWIFSSVRADLVLPVCLPSAVDVSGPPSLNNLCQCQTGILPKALFP